MRTLRARANNMKLNQAYPISTDLFTWIKELGTFTTELSTLQGANLNARLRLRLFDDSCDEGFWLKSARTGKLEAFGYVKAHEDNEGEITHWEYQSCPIGGKILKVEIFND
jgi:hypothetical protein